MPKQYCVEKNGDQCHHPYTGEQTATGNGCFGHTSTRHLIHNHSAVKAPGSSVLGGGNGCRFGAVLQPADNYDCGCSGSYSACCYGLLFARGVGQNDQGRT